VREFVFGYGSLVADVDGAVATLAGARRTWTVAMDNSLDLPGYKYYVEASGRRPSGWVAFLDLTLGAETAVNGVCHEVTPTELEMLDRRERQYSRVDVTDRLLEPVGRVWAYLGRAESRERAARARADGTLRVARAYLEAVHSAFDRLGPAARRAFDASTETPSVPVVDLLRVDVG
jgi:Gamma-glutamyl cyclotransferase, AIG2-like